MLELGFEYRAHKKMLYFDGHERADVVPVRKKYVDSILYYARFMDIYVGEDCTPVPPGTNGRAPLPDNMQEHVLVVHDESAFESNDAASGEWCEKDRMSLQKKGFICATAKK